MMLCLRTPSALPWRSARFASQLSQPSADTQHTAKPPSILSRLSDRTKIRGAEQKKPATLSGTVVAEHRKSPPRTISFVSARSAQKRDDAAEKWFTDVRRLSIDVADNDSSTSLPHKKRVRSGSRQHEMRPATDLNALFSSPTTSRIQTKRELGGDYSSYLPEGHADPHQLPVDYARLILGRNKHIPLSTQTNALNIVEGTIRERGSRRAL